ARASAQGNGRRIRACAHPDQVKGEDGMGRSATTTGTRPVSPQEQPRNATVRAAVFDPEMIGRGVIPAWPHQSGAQSGPGPAPGRPGDEPRWATAAKQGVGTTLDPTGRLTSRVWFTIARGVVTEVFYPHVDHPCIRELGLVITDGQSFCAA